MSNSSDPALESSILDAFTSEMNSRKLEFVTLVGADSRIILGVNNDRSGEVFDPSGVVSRVLATNQRIVVTTVMDNSEFRLEGAKRWL
jgi:twitching motility protein PilJ